ncbi:hypothetical protein GCM10029964_054170 [Kibdelosporangium lantanae]
MGMRALHWITDTAGPFAAAYYDGSHDTEDAGQQLELRWRAARDHLRNQGADEATLAAMDEVATVPTAPGRTGRALVAAQGSCSPTRRWPYRRRGRRRAGPWCRTCFRWRVWRPGTCRTSW